MIDKLLTLFIKHVQFESPNLDDDFFKIKKKTKSKKKILIVSGGSRNGNHLVSSSLDGHSKLPYICGEDLFLSQLFWENLLRKERFRKVYKSKIIYKDIAKLSGKRFDKWKKIFKGNFDNITKAQWSGNHDVDHVPLVEYPNHFKDINYIKYINLLKKNFKNHKFDFDFFFTNYLKSYNSLSYKNDNQKKLAYDYIYALSGLRRELYLLLKKNYNVKCIVPVRNFETFYYSKIYSKYRTLKIKQEYITEAWGHWKNKTLDYMILKQMYPKKIFLVSYEDLAMKKIWAFKKICKFLNIKYEKNLLENTSEDRKVRPNTSFKSRVMKKYNYRGLKLSKKYIPKYYFEIKKVFKEKLYT